MSVNIVQMIQHGITNLQSLHTTDLHKCCQCVFDSCVVLFMCICVCSLKTHAKLENNIHSKFLYMHAFVSNHT